MIIGEFCIAAPSILEFELSANVLDALFDNRIIVEGFLEINRMGVEITW